MGFTGIIREWDTRRIR